MFPKIFDNEFCRAQMENVFYSNIKCFQKYVSIHSTGLKWKMFSIQTSNVSKNMWAFILQGSNGKCFLFKHQMFPKICEHSFYRAPMENVFYSNIKCFQKCLRNYSVGLKWKMFLNPTSNVVIIENSISFYIWNWTIHSFDVQSLSNF